MTRIRTLTAGALVALSAALGAVGTVGVVGPAAAVGEPAPAAPAQRAAYATIEGTGSTWSKIIVDQWIADVDASGIKVVYSGGGSSKGRRDFALDTNDFAISEIPFQGVDEDGNADTSNGREFAYLPIVAGGTAFTYQLRIGNEQVRNLRLSGETLTKIFTNQITTWNDPQIAADNNGRGFPAIPITPVVRSDGSGTTAQLTTWMDKAHPSIWRPYFGQAGLTSYYPRAGRMIGQSGSDQVMNTIKAETGNGTIGYVEYSYPREAGYPVVKVLNRAGYYVEPTQYNTAVALTKARINTQDKNDPSTYLTQILDGVYTNPDPRAYPISSYSYLIMPTGADDRRLNSTAKRQSLADFMFYSLCGGQAKAGDYGYSPLPLNLVQAGFTQLAKLKQADPAVELSNRDVKSCANPTFDGKNPNRNVLAEIAPLPASCDREGEGPCGTDTGTDGPAPDPDGEAPVDTDGDGVVDVPDDGSTGGTSDGSTPGTTSPDGTTPGGTTPGGTTPAGSTPGGTAPGTGPGGTVDGAPTAIDPETGEVVGLVSGDATSTTPAYATPTLVENRAVDSRTFGWVAALELLALVLVPGLIVAQRRRRRTEGAA